MSDHKGSILVLATGEIVTVVRFDSEDWCAARILWAPKDSGYQPGGHDIAVSPLDIASARSTKVTDELAAAIVAASEPTYESKLVVVGEQFRAKNPNANEDENIPSLLWTIDRIDGFTVFCTAEDGSTADFAFRQVSTARSIFLFTSRSLAVTA